MEILTAIAIAPFLAALVLGAREAELEEQNNRERQKYPEKISYRQQWL